MLYTINFFHIQSLDCLHFTSGDPEVQRGEVTCSRSHGWDLSSCLFCPPAALALPSDQLFFPQYNKHLFVHIGQSSPSYSDPYLEAVDIRQIYDKFPEKKGGLKELFERGPSNAFFLVKFWVSL